MKLQWEVSCTESSHSNERVIHVFNEADTVILETPAGETITLSSRETERLRDALRGANITADRSRHVR